MKVGMTLLGVPGLTVAVLLGGCAMAPRNVDREIYDRHVNPRQAWFSDRYRDLLDIASLSLEVGGIGAQATLGPVDVGLFTSRHPTVTGMGGISWGVTSTDVLTGYGLRSGLWGEYAAEQKTLFFGVQESLKWDDDPAACTPVRGYRRKDWNRELPAYAYTRLGVSAALGVGLRLEFNPGELVDFVLGWFGFDIYGQTAGLDDLTRPEIFNLDGSRLSEMSPKIADFSSLRHLYVRNNSLKGLPPEIGKLAKLETLWADHNMLTNLPEELGKLVELGDLDLSHNRLTTLPPGLAGLESLRRLSLTDNPLGHWPPVLSSLPSIRDLHLGNTGIREIPDSVAELQELRELDVNDNPITAIPVGALAKLEKLKYLSVPAGVSCDQVRELRLALPELVVWSNSRPICQGERGREDSP